MRKNIIDIINEEILVLESVDYMTITDLADLITNAYKKYGMEFNTVLKYLTNAFKNNGDEGVEKSVKDLTQGQTKVQSLGTGRYTFKF